MKCKKLNINEDTVIVRLDRKKKSFTRGLNFGLSLPQIKRLTCDVIYSESHERHTSSTTEFFGQKQASMNIADLTAQGIKNNNE